MTSHGHAPPVMGNIKFYLFINGSHYKQALDESGLRQVKHE
jgi:hypothetical protein